MITIPKITFSYITFLGAVGEQNRFKCVISSWNNLNYFPLSFSSCMPIHPHNQKETPCWLCKKGVLHSFLYKCFKSLFYSSCESSLKQLCPSYELTTFLANAWEMKHHYFFFLVCLFAFFGWIVSLFFIHAWFKLNNSNLDSTKVEHYIVSRKTLLVQFCSLTFNTWKLIYP